MRCPFCGTDNREDRETCYHCDKDLTILRLIANKARHHYNLALEHAERHRYYEAIGELRNALDLDANLVEAYVVLGTVYARLNRPEEAREAWEKALSTSKTFERAHNYLGQIKQIRPYQGVLRRLRYVLAAMALLAGISLILLLMLVWPDVTARTLDGAWRSYRQNDLSAARARLGEVSRPISDRALELSAQSLEFSIERDVQEALASIERLRAENQPLSAVRAAQNFLRRHPPAAAAETAQNLLEHSRSFALAQVRQHITQVDESTVHLDLARRSAKEFIDFFPTAPERSDLEKLLAEAELRHARLRLEAIRAAFLKNHEYAAARSALGELLADVAGSPSQKSIRRPAERLLTDVNLGEFSEMTSRARAAMKAGDLPAAEQALRLADAIRPLDNSQHADLYALRRQLDRRQEDILLAAVDSRLEARDWDGVVAEIDRASSLTLASAARERIDRVLARAKKARAVESYHWLLRRASSSAEAQSAAAAAADSNEILRRSQLVLDDLPFDLYPEALDDVLYMRALAFAALGHRSESAAALERLREARPKSRYLPQISAGESSPGGATNSPPGSS